jgi:hypothetical protein
VQEVVEISSALSKVGKQLDDLTTLQRQYAELQTAHNTEIEELRVQVATLEERLKQTTAANYDGMDMGQLIKEMQAIFKQIIKIVRRMK